MPLLQLPQTDKEIGTYNYNLSFTFVKEISKVSVCNKYYVSLDVCSLFTSIPLEETIKIAVDLIINNDKNIKISKKELTNLFMIATARTHFLFQGSFYDQIDGVAMGSPLAPILANLFMGHFEHKWIPLYSQEKPTYYRLIQYRKTKIIIA